MKRILTTATFLICSLLTTFAQFSGSGNGTEDDPYLIFNETQLAQVSNFLNQEGVVFKLMKDLDLTDWIAENNPRQGWLPIGVESMPFMGKFLGNNHKVSGLMINRSSTDYVGFFGYISGASIDNLTIEGSSVMGASNVGGFLGYASGSEITNCNLSITTGVEGTNNVGGFVGQSLNSNYSNFNVEASVKAQSYLGGFVGLAEGGNWQQGFVSGQRTSTGEYAGGFAGKLTSVTLSDIKQKGNVSGQDYTGGFVGCSSNGKFTRCDVESNVQGAQYVSGFAGALEVITSSFNTCFHKGTITATGDYAGGIVGVSKGGCIEEMESCSHFGDMQGRDFIGGLIGEVQNIAVEPIVHTYYNYPYESSYDSSTLEPVYYYEHIYSGSTIKRNINNCSSIGNIIANSYAGGLIGKTVTSKAFTSESHFEEDNSWYSSKQKKYIYKYYYDVDGNIVGKTLTYYDYKRNTINLSITNNFFCGTLQGIDNIGGLVGYNSGGEFKYNYTNANIYGVNNVGGIVGQTSRDADNGYNNATTIKSNVANVSTVSATISNVGKIFGLIDAEYTTIGALGSSESNRALAQAKVVLSGVVQDIEDDLQNGNSIGPSALKLKANYVSWGWNFDENWNILETESFPYKKYQAAPPVIESELVSQATSISGKSVDGGTVYLYYKDRDAISTESNNYKWTFNTEALQSGANVQIYADVEGMFPSYFTTATVGYPGSGTEADPWRIYTAEDLQGASNKGYYKVMNDIDLTQWINENSPVEGWPAIGRNSGEATYIDGDNHKITGLWINTSENYNGLFSNFSAGQIKNLNVEVAAGKKVKGGDYTGILIGRNANGIIENCTVKGDVEGTLHVGGVAGFTEATTISTILFDGSVTTTSENAFVGSIAGQMKNCTVSNCDAEAAISAGGAGSKVGGLAGEAFGGSITKSTINNNLAATGADSYVGGLVGYAETPVTLSMTSGNVSATGENSYTGGLVGYALSPIANCYSVANVTGTQFSAGLVGYTFSTIDKCYAKGDIYGVMYGGGVVGELDGPAAVLTNSVACNNILSLSAQSSWGSRVIGGFKNGAADPDESNYALSTMQVSLNNVPQKKTDDIVEGIAKTQAELMSYATYNGIGWDFSAYWSIDEGVSYPYLAWEEEKSLVTSITFDKTSLVLAAGTSETITATVLPEKATHKNLVWTSDNLAVATVEGGVVTAVAIGTANVTATATDGSDVSATCAVTVIQGSNDKLSVPDLTAHTGKQIMLPVSMQNEGVMSGFQFDLVLPDGVTIASDEEGELLVEGTSRIKNFTISARQKASGAYGIVAMSVSGKTISGNDGEVLNITVDIANTLAAGDYTIQLKDIQLTTGEMTTVYVPNVTSSLTVTDVTLGDVNDDGTINVTDAICVVNHILEQEPPMFIEAAADVNGDNTINVTDAICIVNIILSDESTVAKAPFVQRGTNAGDLLSLFQDENGSYHLNLSNSGSYSGFQFDVALSEGMTINDVVLNSLRRADHVVSYTRLHNGDYRVVALSFSGATFRGHEGELARICATGNGAVTIKVVRFVTADLQEVAFDVNTTGIETIGNSQLINSHAVYDLQGRKRETSLPYMPGVYVVNGKKIVVR